MTGSLTFAVYDGPIAHPEESGQLINRSSLFDRFSSLYPRIDSPRIFATEVNQITHSKYGNLLDSSSQFTISEVLQLYWLTHVIEKFLASPCDYLVIIDSVMWFPDGPGIQAYFDVLLAQIPQEVDVLSLYLPEFLRQKSEESVPHQDLLVQELVRHDPISYLFTRDGAEKYLQMGRTGFTCSFGNLFFDSKYLKTSLIRQDLKHSPSVFSALYAATEKMKSEESLIFGHHFDIQKPSGNEVGDENKKAFTSFASHWFKTEKSLMSTLGSFRALGRTLNVINTTDEPNPEFISFPRISFFDQFEFACQEFAGLEEFMLFFTADIASSDWSGFFDRAEDVIAHDKVGSYCPALTYDLYNYGGTELLRSARGDLVCANYTDAICVFLRREVVEELLGFFRFFRSHPETFSVQVGWGMSVLIAYAVEMMDLLNVQDRSFVIHHPASRSYSSEVAGLERDRILIIATEYFEMRRQILTGNKDRPTFDAQTGQVELDTISDSLMKRLGI